MSWVEGAKRRVARAAAAHVESGSVLGLGSGSTARYFIQIVGRRLSERELSDILGVPTSVQAAADALESGIPMTSLDEHPELDLAVDGADQIDGGLEAIKGGGGALLREKVVASASKYYILIADERKLTQRLGEGCPLPVEVLPFSLGAVLRNIGKMGALAVLRKKRGKQDPVLTDNGNFVVDADFGAISDPKRLEADLKAIPGVLESGLFLGYADIAYIGTPDSLKKMQRKEIKSR